MAKTTLLTIHEYIRRKAFNLGSGTVQTEVSPTTRARETTFINDANEIQRLKLEEYNVWYAGDSAQILNFYTRADFIDFNYDPIYNRNFRNLFWATSATEQDYKRTHSGVPRVIVDTLSGIVSVPHVGSTNKTYDARLKKILKDNNYNELLSQEARPLSLVGGWGAWKINFDEDLSDTPILLYYRAGSVDFFYRNRRLVSIVYQDYYTDEDDKKYVLFETRRLERRSVKDEEATGISEKKMCLVIEKELFRYLSEDSNQIQAVPLDTLPELRDVQPCLVVENCPYFLGAPIIYFNDSTGLCPGRSIFTGKIDLFDDLDKELSQKSNAVTRSTPIEYIDSQYLERDENTGQPKQPKLFDRKFIMVASVLTGDGQMARQPVTVTQPQINFEQYSTAAVNTIIEICNGIMSPATIGLDIAKNENGVSQREKEKVTIFTRNGLIGTEQPVQESIMIQLLIADQLLHSQEEYNKIELPDTEEGWGISVKYDEFADASFEAKLETVMTGWQGGILSDDMAIEYLHRGAPQSIKDRELKFIKKQREEEKQLAGRIPGGEEPGDGTVLTDDEAAKMGEILGGNQGNDYNEEHEKVDISDAREDNGVPRISEYKDYEKNRKERIEDKK